MSEKREKCLIFVSASKQVTTRRDPSPEDISPGLPNEGHDCRNATGSTHRWVLPRTVVEIPTPHYYATILGP